MLQIALHQYELDSPQDVKASQTTHRESPRNTKCTRLPGASCACRRRRCRCPLRSHVLRPFGSIPTPVQSAGEGEEGGAQTLPRHRRRGQAVVSSGSAAGFGPGIQDAAGIHAAGSRGGPISTVCWPVSLL